MRCIILAGGLGKRLRPLTNHTPKALLEIAGKPLIEHTLSALPDEITSVVIAVKHLGQKIKARVGKKFGKKRITYVNLTSLRGTMDAVRQCKKYIKGKTLVINGDDLYIREDLSRLVEQSKKEPTKWFLLVKEEESYTNVARVVINKQGEVDDIIEVSPEGKCPISFHDREKRWDINTGAYVIDERIFQYKPAKLANGEFGLPQTMLQAKRNIPIIAVRASFWFPLNTKEDLMRLRKVFDGNEARIV